MATRTTTTTTTTATTTAFWMAVRLVRRGALVLAAVVAAWMVLEVASYLVTYPDAASRARLAQFDTPALRMMQGPPEAVDTVGGFVAWDAGWFLQFVLGVWVLLAVTRLLRGEEQDDRAELMLAAPLRPTHATAAALVAVALACLLVGAAAAAALVVSGVGVSGSALFGLALAGSGATVGGTAALASQLFAERRWAVTASACALAGFYLLRVVASSTDERVWVRWTTPFGWVDALQPYSGQRLLALVPLLGVPVLLAALAVALRARRDTGAGLVPTRDRPLFPHRPVTSTLALSWRLGRGVLLGWLLGLAVYAAVMGALLTTMVDFLAGDESLTELLRQMGLDMARPEAFVGAMAGFFGLAFALYVCWRIAAARTEEATARAENLFVRPVTRQRWLGGQILLAAGGAVLLAVGCGAALWAGARATGGTGGEVDLWPSVQAMLAVLPPAAAAAGLAVALFGVAPRLTLPVSAGLVVAAFLLEMIGPALDWPSWVVAISPFHHLAMVPLEAFALTPALVVIGAGVALALFGVVAFRRRDLVGA